MFSANSLKLTRDIWVFQKFAPNQPNHEEMKMTSISGWCVPSNPPVPASTGNPNVDAANMEVWTATCLANQQKVQSVGGVLIKGAEADPRSPS